MSTGTCLALYNQSFCHGNNIIQCLEVESKLIEQIFFDDKSKISNGTS